MSDWKKRVHRAFAVISPSTLDRLRLTGFIQDVRYGVRLLRRQPGFAAVAILTISVGVGATTMLFSVADGVLLKPLPWPDPDRLVRVTETRQGRIGRVAGTVSNGTFLAWRDHPSTIEDVGGWMARTATLTGAGDPIRVPINPTPPSLFAIGGARWRSARPSARGSGASSGNCLSKTASSDCWAEPQVWRLPQASSDCFRRCCRRVSHGWMPSPSIFAC